MPLRFRKSFKILPGVKINLSKSGISTSIGGRGASVNIGKRGTRTTVGLPGTGISYLTTSPAKTSTPRKTHPQSSSNQKFTNSSGCINGLFTLIVLPFRVLGDLVKSFLDPTTRKSTSILIGVLVGVCILCVGVTNIVGSDNDKGTPTPAIDLNAINTQAMIDAWSVYTQTAAALPTETSTSTIEPTLAITDTPMPTDTLQPTNTPIPTFTLIPTSTQFFSPLPTQIPASGGACCKRCGSNSQPCGDTCISKKYTCHTAPGCACP